MSFSDILGGVGGIFGAMSGAGDEDYDKARQEQVNALAGLEDEKTPGLEALKVQLAQQDPSSFAGITTDPALRQAQMSALQRLEQEGSSGGMTTMDRAREAQALGSSAAQERGQRDAIMQGMAQRGQVGGGAELAAMLQNQQGAAQRGNEAGTEGAAQANMRALQAIAGAGSLGGSIRGQDYGEQAQRAQAQDAINRFNTDNRNRQSLYNSNMAQQDWQNRWGRAQGISAGRQQLGGYYQDQGNRALGKAEGIGSAIGRTVGGVADFGAGGGFSGGPSQLQKKKPEDDGSDIYSSPPQY